MPAEGASLGEPYSTYYTRVRVINNGGTTSGGSSVLRSLFPTPFYVDYDAVSSFQPPATPRVPHSIASSLPSPANPSRHRLALAVTSSLGRSTPLLSSPSERGTYTQSTRLTPIHGRRSPCAQRCGPSCEIRTARQHGSATDL